MDKKGLGNHGASTLKDTVSEKGTTEINKTNNFKPNKLTTILLICSLLLIIGIGALIYKKNNDQEICCALPPKISTTYETKCYTVRIPSEYARVDTPDGKDVCSLAFEKQVGSEDRKNINIKTYGFSQEVNNAKEFNEKLVEYRLASIPDSKLISNGTISENAYVGRGTYLNIFQLSGSYMYDLVTFIGNNYLEVDGIESGAQGISISSDSRKANDNETIEIIKDKVLAYMGL